MATCLHSAEPFRLVNTAVPIAQIAVGQQNVDRIENIQAGQFNVPRVSINGINKQIHIGDLVELTATINDKPEDLYSVNYSWAVLPQKDVIVWPDGTKIIFGTGTTPKVYTVILTTSFVYTVMNEGKIVDIIQKTTTNIEQVTIKGDTNSIPETPKAGDNSSLANLTYNWTSLISRGNDYPTNKFKEDALRLSESFKNIANDIDNGNLKDITSILNTTRDKNDTVVENRNAWLPWFNKVSEHLQSSYADGSIKTTSQFSAAWKEISKGLLAASK